MAPKLPPPANTKAVLAEPAWLDADKPLTPPISPRHESRTALAELIAGSNRVASSRLVVGGGQDAHYREQQDLVVDKRLGLKKATRDFTK
jgi:hypothetical protein